MIAILEKKVLTSVVISFARITTVIFMIVNGDNDFSYGKTIGDFGYDRDYDSLRLGLFTATTGDYDYQQFFLRLFTIKIV